MISEEERKAIEMIKEQKENVEYNINAMECTPEDYDEDVYNDCVEWNKNAKTILNLIETQNKMIELMEEELKKSSVYVGCGQYFEKFDCDSIEEIIEYFRNKAKESE